DPRGLLQYVITDENWEEIVRVPVPLSGRTGPDQDIVLRWEGTPGVEDGRVPWRYRHARFLKLLGSKTVHVLDSWRVETLGELDEERGINTVRQDRKSTRLNSSHVKISYAVFCLKQKKNR